MYENKMNIIFIFCNEYPFVYCRKWQRHIFVKEKLLKKKFMTLAKKVIIRIELYFFVIFICL